MKKEHWTRFLPTVVAILLISTYRILPHPWNFGPVCATAIFGGMYLNRYLAYSLPLASMFIADLFLGLDWFVTPVIYGSIALSTWIGSKIGNNSVEKPKFAAKIFTGTIASAILFFIATNFVTWLTLETYTKDLNGFAECYIMAIPFFRNALVGDLFFVSVFVIIYETTKVLATKMSPVEVRAK